MSPSAIHNLGLAPTVEQVDQWLRTDHGLSAQTVGKSLEGRDIVMYAYNHAQQNEYDETDDIPVILFLSLVHGNEVMGLLSLLQTANFIVTNPGPKSFRVLFVPFVNVDAYTLNLQHGQGCRRTNLRSTCNNADISRCPAITPDGVDLNRNYPIDWRWDDEDGQENAFICSHNYHGPEP